MTRIVAFTMFGTLPLGFLATLWSFALFDRLLRIQFSEHHPEWERLGCPPGFFWVPSGAKTLLGGFSRGGLLWEWTARAPVWVSQSESALSAYRSFRRASIGSRVVLGLFLVEFAVLLLSIFTGVFER